MSSHGNSSSDWEADDRLWNVDEQEKASPWCTTSDIDPNTDTGVHTSKLSSDEFSSLSVAECNSLCSTQSRLTFTTDANGDVQRASNSTSNSTEDGKTTAFETDHNYLSKLERKLDKLYKLSGKAEKKSMLRQVSDRANVVFVGEGDRQDSSTDTEILPHPVSLRLFPQQAITVEEKLELLKNDHLVETVRDVIDVPEEQITANVDTDLIEQQMKPTINGTDSPD